MAMRRTAVGIDLGTTDVFAANVGRKGVDIVQNGVSERRTPALVSFTARRRLLGDAAAAQVKSNFRNSCRNLKHLVGLGPDVSQVDVERFWSLCPLGAAADGDVGFQVSYRDETKCLSAKVCLSMLLTSVVATCATWTQMNVSDVVLAIPPYFTEQNRQACLDALSIAGINCLRLLHDTTALALAWRFDRRDFDDTKPIIVALCSAGQSVFSVAIARYEKGTVTMLGEAWDRSVSGRNMDRNIMEMFAASMKKQGAPDPLESAKARLKLEEAASKVKKTLSVTDEARGTAECVIEDFDLNCDVKRAAFEEFLEPWGEKIQAVVNKALHQAKLTASDLTYVEVVGGVSRVPFVQRSLRAAFEGRELSTTLNADEAVSRGCAWQAAMLSPLIRLNPIPLHECGQFGIAIEWEDCENVEAEGSQLVNGRRRLVIFEDQAGPNIEVEVGLKVKGTLTLTAVYISADAESTEVDLGGPSGSWALKFPNKKLEDVEILCSVDLNGMFSVSKAMLCIGKEEEALSRAKAAEEEAQAKIAAEAEKARIIEEQLKLAEEEEAKRKADEEAAATAAQEAADKADSNEEGAADAADADGTGSKTEDAVADAGDSVDAEAKKSEEVNTGAEEGSADANPKDGKVPDSKEQPAQEPEEINFGGDEETPKSRSRFGSINWRFWQWRRGRSNTDAATNPDAAAATGPQKRTLGTKIAMCKREPVDVIMTEHLGYTDKALKAAVKDELAFRSCDNGVIEAENLRNDFETYIFAIRGKVAAKDPVMEYASSEEQSTLSDAAQAAEDWVYEHIEEEASVYKKKLKELKSSEDKFTSRKTTAEGIQEKIKALKNSIKRYKASAIAPVYDHIAKDKLEAMRVDCDSTNEWLSDLEKRHAAQTKWEDPVVSIVELNVRNSTLTTNCMKILSEPRPKPPQKEEPKKEAKGNKKDKKDKNKDSKDSKESKDSKDGKDETSIDADEDEDASSSTTPPEKRNMRRLLLRFLLPLVVIVPVAAIFAGYGEPYGIQTPHLAMPSLPSFWPFGQANQEDGGIEDLMDAAESGELAGVETDLDEPEAETPVQTADDA